MNAERRAAEGRTTPFESARPGIERTLVAALLAIRAVHVVQGFACVMTARAAYRRPRIAAVTALASLAEFGWLAVRDARLGYHGPKSARVDAAFCIGALVTLQAATEVADRSSPINWMLPLTVGSCLGAAGGLPRSQSTAIASILGTTYAVGARHSIRRGSGDAAAVIANTLSLPAFFLVGNVVVRLARRLAADVDEAKQTAVAEGARAAAEVARNREHRLLHDSALQTLEAVAGAYAVDSDDLRRQARQEASALRRAISGELAQMSSTLVSGLNELAEEYHVNGLRVELVALDADPQPAADVVVALCGAVREALTNVMKHAGVATAVVNVGVSEGGVQVTVRDQGGGFDQNGVSPGFGVSNSIIARLDEVGGRARLWSAPGRGTRVELWAPA